MDNLVEYVDISTKQGKLKGLVKKSEGVSGKTYYSFQGIPYAKPPIGKLRFKTPEPYGQWEGVRDATKEGNDCVQRHMIFSYPTGDEDCFYLNVYSTQIKEEGAKKAVMVWIHGGGFNGGSGSTELYGPDFLIEEDIVLVSINYRCGALGFLSLENEKVPGNLGLKDQVLALQWIQQNIHSFGGDPNNVTIFGESAGSGSVHYHLLSPLSRGLFHKAILQSGTSLSEWAFQSKPREKALLLARELGCTSQDPDTVLEFLMTVPAANIVEGQHKDTLPSEKEKIHRFSYLFVPCVEVAGSSPFLPDYPRKIMDRGEFSDVPVIMGLTEKEGVLALVLGAIYWDIINKDSSIMVPVDVKIPAGSEEERKLGKEILQFYTNKEVISWDDAHGYVDFVTDVHMTIALEYSRQCFLKHKTTPLYFYMFSYVSQRSLSFSSLSSASSEKSAELVGCGASHGDELVHQFKSNMAQVPYVPPTPDDQAFMKKFLKAWTTFAKTGNPNCKELGAIWEPDSIQTPHFLNIGKVFKPVDGIVFPKRTEFWNKIYEKYPRSY